MFIAEITIMTIIKILANGEKNNSHAGGSEVYYVRIQSAHCSIGQRRYASPATRSA